MTSNSDTWQASKYLSALENIDKQKYKGKLTLKNGTILPDPYALVDSSWKDDMKLLPNIQWGDLYMYLINTPSEYTHESFKAFKSMEAYNFFVCGHVQDVFIHNVTENSEFCFLKSKVLPSQRQGQKTKLYDVWVCLHKVKGHVLTGNCTCMAGLGSACSHVAALLFKLEACIRIGGNKVAVTSELCAWNRCRKNAVPTLLQNINFKRPRKDQLPEENEPKENPVLHYSAKENWSYCFKLKSADLAKLREIAPEAAFFTSLTNVSNDNVSDRDTATADENEENLLPEPITSIFDYEAVNLQDLTLMERYNEFKKAYCQENYETLASVTSDQSLSKAWKLHRFGRITASNFHEVLHRRASNTSNSLLFKIMGYTNPPTLPAMTYGREKEDIARNYYLEVMKKEHLNFTLKTSGLHIDADHPHLGASPDGLVKCDCHGEGLIEIKCPYKYRFGFVEWQSDAQFPIDENGKLKNTHKYFTQVQGQMLVLKKPYCDFLVWSPAGNNFLVRITRDLNFIQEMKTKLDLYYFNTVLKETVIRENDICLDNKQKNYCLCRRPCFEPMIACDHPGCKVEWYHYACVNVTRAPKGKWVCPNCLKE